MSDMSGDAACPILSLAHLLEALVHRVVTVDSGFRARPSGLAQEWCGEAGRGAGSASLISLRGSARWSQAGQPAWFLPQLHALMHLSVSKSQAAVCCGPRTESGTSSRTQMRLRFQLHGTDTPALCHLELVRKLCLSCEPR